mgnify:CR=1 FL=1
MRLWLGGWLAIGHAGAQPWTDAELLEDLEQRTFLWFWETSHPVSGLAPDRGPPPSAASVAAVGFALTAYPVGVERGYITRGEAVGRVLTTLRFLAAIPEGPGATGVGAYRGFFYHFLDLQTGLRSGPGVELSSIDTAWLMMGVLCCQNYFDADIPDESEIRTLADTLYRRVEWDWMVVRPPRICLGWTPDAGFLPYDYTGYNEAMGLYVLALGSPTHLISDAAWDGYTAGYVWADYHGQEHVNFGSLFGHQYSHSWIDFRGIRDAYMRERGIDYAENSRRATLAQRAYAIANPGGWTGYDADVWGLTASDGPGELELDLPVGRRRFFGYRARGAAVNYVVDDGTLAPTAAVGSLPFAPEVVIPAIRAMRTRYGDAIYDRHGFVDAFNPTFTATHVLPAMGRVISGMGWVDTQHLGIDQGPIVLQVANHRDSLIWRVMQRSPYLISGLRRAGFTGGWLDAPPGIATAPRHASADVGGSFALGVSATGAGPFDYQWSRDGVELPGETSATFSRSAATLADAGVYRIRVSNAHGAVESEGAVVQVHATAASLINLSTRGYVGPGGSALIAGCTVAGSHAMPLLIRVVGPTLARFQLDPAALLRDPRCEIRSLQGPLLASNDNWGGATDPAAIAATAARVGAFALPQEGLDAALLYDSAAGIPFTVVSTGASPGIGIALVEIYAADEASGTRLINLSTRGYAGVGDAILIPGFYLGAGGSRRLLIRAVGPSLARVAPDLQPLLADPIVVVRRAPGGDELARNDDWGETEEDRATILAAQGAVHAFALGAGSKDAALVLEVGPSVFAGADRGFTLEVRDAGGGSGLVLAEIYAMPAP